MGRLKASQKRTKREILSEALMSMAPAIIIGCCATTPTALPVQPREPHDGVLRPTRVDFEEAVP